MAKVVAASPHSMGLERVIGIYEMIKCSVRVSLNPSTVDDIIFVKMNMPPTSVIDLRPIVMDFIKSRERRNRKKDFDLMNVIMKKEYFKTFFPGVPSRVRKSKCPVDSDWEVSSDEMEFD